MDRVEYPASSHLATEMESVQNTIQRNSNKSLLLIKMVIQFIEEEIMVTQWIKME
jgi:hypothetical protein